MRSGGRITFPAAAPFYLDQASLPKAGAFQLLPVFHSIRLRFAAAEQRRRCLFLFISTAILPIDNNFLDAPALKRVITD